MNKEKASIVYALKPKPHRGGASAGSYGYLAGVTSFTYGDFQKCLGDVVPENEVKGARPVISVIREEGQEDEEVLVTGRNVAITGKEIEITAGATDEGVVLSDVKTGETVAEAEIVSTTLIETVCTFAALPPNGRYRLEVRTRGGLGLAYKVATAGRDVVVGTMGI